MGMGYLVFCIFTNRKKTKLIKKIFSNLCLMNLVCARRLQRMHVITVCLKREWLRRENKESR